MKFIRKQSLFADGKIKGNWKEYYNDKGYQLSFISWWVFIKYLIKNVNGRRNC
jgi:hypothetical protein